MPRDIDGFVPDQGEPTIDSAWVIQEARRIGLELSQAEVEVLLREADIIYKSKLDHGQKVSLESILTDKIQKIKIEKETITGFINSFDEARALYFRFGRARQEEPFYIFPREKPHSIVDRVANLKKRTLEGAKEYFEDLVIKYRKILDKIGSEFPAERRIFIIVGIGEGARVASASFKITKTGEISARYEHGKKTRKPYKDGRPGKETITYTTRTVSLDSVYLTEEEAKKSLTK